ncbi:MucB/RseB C-terminal domain-containing protein [Glaesserella sp.]|uniref:MucB/RseB C-terminal domain-containing protein n=1 Tax=Glaesserella sp. TaxID=2094731 RepID=UPI00359FFFBE
MKKLPFIYFFVMMFLSFFARAEQLQNPLAYLNEMTKAHQTLNYEQFYILQHGETTESLRYRHAYWNGKKFAQLLVLDGSREEIILRDDIVSYFGDFQPFSLPSRYILDNLPSVLYSNFNQLEGYHFIDAGRERIANRIARVIRIVAVDDFRYQYTLWIDEENYLLLKSNLTDRDNNVLEQFRVIQSTVDEQLLYIVEPISSLILPALITHKENDMSNQLEWMPTWLPRGFKALASGRQSLSEMLMSNEHIESQLYSDGLFTFTVYVVENRGIVFNEQFWREGKMSIYSQTIDDKDIVIVGEIPLVTARHIVQELRHSVSAEEREQ